MEYVFSMIYLFHAEIVKLSAYYLCEVTAESARVLTSIYNTTLEALIWYRDYTNMLLAVLL